MPRPIFVENEKTPAILKRVSDSRWMMTIDDAPVDFSNPQFTFFGRSEAETRDAASKFAARGCTISVWPPVGHREVK